MIYTDDFKQEAHRFYVYNFLGWRVPTTTAHYIESKTQSPHIHTRLARELMERSGILGHSNVEIMSNNLSRNSAKMVTFGTLVDSLRLAFPDLDDESYSPVLEYLVQFIAELSRIRPKEIALLSVGQRRTVRDTSVADQATLWQAYIRLAAWLREQNEQNWRDWLKVLGEPYVHGQNGKTQRFDFFSRENPIWVERGILAPGKKGFRVVNNRPSRQAAFETLKEII